MNNEPQPPERLPRLMRAYLDGELDLDRFVAEIIPLWQDGGWAPYFDPAHLSEEELKRAQAFQRRFAKLTRPK